MGLIRKIWFFYYDGFKNMTVGKKLWLIIIIKLIIIFAVLRIFFFKPVLKGTDEQKAESVRQSLVKNSAATDSTENNYNLTK